MEERDKNLQQPVDQFGAEHGDRLSAPLGCPLGEAVIDRDIEEVILNALAPVPVVPSRRRAMFARILARVHAPTEGFMTVRSEDREWILRAPGVYEKRLLEEAGRSASLYRLLPGSSFPAHAHPSDEECLCLEGEVSLGGIVIRHGDFHLAPQGIPHGEITTETGCLLYIRCGSVAELTEMD